MGRLIFDSSYKIKSCPIFFLKASHLKEKVTQRLEKKQFYFILFLNTT